MGFINQFKDLWLVDQVLDRYRFSINCRSVLDLITNIGSGSFPAQECSMVMWYVVWSNSETVCSKIGIASGAVSGNINSKANMGLGVSPLTSTILIATSSLSVPVVTVPTGRINPADRAVCTVWPARPKRVAVRGVTVPR